MRPTTFAGVVKVHFDDPSLWKAKSLLLGPVGPEYTVPSTATLGTHPTGEQGAVAAVHFCVPSGFSAYNWPLLSSMYTTPSAPTTAAPVSAVVVVTGNTHFCVGEAVVTSTAYTAPYVPDGVVKTLPPVT